MKITIICVGKIKEKYLKDAVLEYKKRLSRFCKIDIVEVLDKEIPDNCSANEEELVKKKEAQEILKRLNLDSEIIVLDIRGEMLDSCELAQKINNYMTYGKSNISIIIGGSLGLHKNVLDIANYKLSFSKMTFPHKLMRVILLEQLYRAFKIINNETYHK